MFWVCVEATSRRAENDARCALHKIRLRESLSHEQNNEVDAGGKV